jgi:signal transduction histidine kinase
VRPALEKSVGQPGDQAAAESAFNRLAGISLVGAIGYSVLPAAAWVSGSAIGQVLAAAGWCGGTSQVLVYFSSNVKLIAANLAPSAAVALFTPLLSGEAGWLERVLASAVLMSILAATSVFAKDRNKLLGSLAVAAQARSSAETANESKRQFLGVLSHELRTPLDAIVGYAELLQEDLSELGQAQLAADATQISGAGRQMLELVNRIIILARLEAGEMRIERAETALVALIGQAAAQARARAEQNASRLTLHLPDLGAGEVDPDKLAQCVEELCVNAGKFTRNGAIEVSATRELIAGVDTLRIEVADTGPGVSDAVAANMFQPFVHVGARSTSEGAGAGLAVVRGLMRALGGDVSWRNRFGGGAVFTLTCPLSGAPQTARAA